MTTDLATLQPSSSLSRDSFLHSLLRLWDRVPATHLAGAVLLVLLGGILGSVLTTTDPDWWTLHFSQLGTFPDVSGALFNGTLQLGGLLVVVFALRVSRVIRKLGRGAGRRGAYLLALACFTTMGVNLSLVGFIPVNTDSVLHDRVAGAIILGFLVLLISAPIMLHRLPRRLVLTTAGVILWMALWIWLFVAGTINLALFEAVSFAAIFGWSGVFVSSLRATAQSAVSAQSESELAPAREG